MYLFSILFLLAIGLFFFVRNQSPTLPKQETKTVQIAEQTQKVYTPISPISKGKKPHRTQAYYKKKKARNRKRNRIARKSRQINRL